MAEVTLEGVGKTYRGGAAAVSDVTLAVRDGEFVVLVGPRAAASPRCCG
jgi:ABC-type sugar transport system ATPase subunit